MSFLNQRKYRVNLSRRGKTFHSIFLLLRNLLLCFYLQLNAFPSCLLICPFRKDTVYIADLLDYLIYFFWRTEPLQELDIILYKVSTDFKEQYADGKVEGWVNHGHEDELIPYHAVRDLQGLLDAGPEKLNEHLHLKSLMEAKVKKICNLLDETIERTKQNVKKKQALAFEEMEEENHLKGWDGKPIPYWLCKLGLGQEYRCEICRDCSYAGKRAFERHFKERCHQSGLRRLGIQDTEKRFDGITSIEEAKELSKGIPKRKRGPLPHWQFKGEEVKEKNSNQDPAGVAIPPPDIRSKLERLARFVSVTGVEHEVLLMHEEVENLKFWKSSDPYHEFYQHKLTEYRPLNQVAARIQSQIAADRNLLSAEYMVPPMPLEIHKFTYRLPEGITRKDLDVIKLTVEFWVRSGGCYFKGFSEKEIRDHQLEFMYKASDGRFSVFGGFVCVYSDVLMRRPETVKDELRENAADIETVLENCYHRLQWDRFQRELWEKKVREETDKPLPRLGRRSNWRDNMGPPPPQLEPAKRQKIDESELVPEKQFLAQHPGVVIGNRGKFERENDGADVSSSKQTEDKRKNRFI